MTSVSRLFAVFFICAFISEVIMMASIVGEHTTGHYTVVSEADSTNFLVLIMEGCEESEEETDSFRIEFDLEEIIACFLEFQSSSFVSSVRNFRSGIQLYSSNVPVYTAIHAFLI